MYAPLETYILFHLTFVRNREKGVLIGTNIVHLPQSTYSISSRLGKRRRLSGMWHADMSLSTFRIINFQLQIYCYASRKCLFLSRRRFVLGTGTFKAPRAEIFMTFHSFSFGRANWMRTWRLWKVFVNLGMNFVLATRMPSQCVWSDLHDRKFHFPSDALWRCGSHDLCTAKTPGKLHNF